MVAALDMLIPKSLEESMTGRPELKTYAQRLQYAQAHVMHHRANVQSAALAKDSNAMQLGNLDACPEGTSAEQWAAFQDWQQQQAWQAEPQAWQLQQQQYLGRSPRAGAREVRRV